jgi:thiol:disulfide interchange protein DsbC
MKKKSIISLALWIPLAIFLLASHSPAFVKDGCGAGECRDCHDMSKSDAAKLLSISEGLITEVKFAEIPGLWEVDVRQQEKVIPVFIDFSKQYMISGSIIKIADRQDITRKRYRDLNRVDVAEIPMEDALVVGDPSARHKIIVFDDPECPFCEKLQWEMKKVVEERSDIAFFIKMFPLKSHPNAYDKAKAIVCAKSLAMLEDSLAGRPLPPPGCETDVIDRNIELAAKLGINSTPTLILPDGLILPGYKKADEIIALVDRLDGK